MASTSPTSFGSFWRRQIARVLGQSRPGFEGFYDPATTARPEAAAALYDQRRAEMKGQADELRRLRMRRGFLATLFGGAPSADTTPRKTLLG